MTQHTNTPGSAALKRCLSVLAFCISALFTPIFAQPCDCVSTGNCPVPITDNGTFLGSLDVTVDGANDLGTCPLTSVCFSITHTWIGDLSVSLTSPDGTSYLIMADANNNFGGCGMQEDNIEVCIGLGNGNPLTNNTEYICNAGPCTSGTCCLTGSAWTVPCGGVTDPITNIPQAPNCNLNDFNQPGAPANGTWVLRVNDVCNMDTGTLNNFSLNFSCGTTSCIVCEADGGELDSLNLRTCEGSPSLLLELPPDYGAGTAPDTAAYSYAYVISQGGTILAVDSLPDLTGQPAGTYQVHGLSYLTADSAEIASLVGLDTALIDLMLTGTTSPFCGDLSLNFITVIIEAAPVPTSISATLCAGDCITVGGSPVCASDTISLTSWLGCDSLVYVDITQILVSADISPAGSPALTCNSPTALLDGSGSSPSGVTFAWTGPNGFASNSPSVTASEPGTYSLTVSENSVNPACTSVASIEVLDGFVPPDLAVSGASQICNGSSFDLSSLTIQDLNNTNPAITFHSASPAGPANELPTSAVSPTATTTYYVLAVTGDCSDEAPVSVTVNNPPTADFATSGTTCLTATTSVTYAGSASASANYTWDFGGGSPSPGNGQGPYEVTWANPGTYTITLTVEENGCTSSVFSENVTVDAPLPAPVINCNTTTESIEFTWANVPGATGYAVNMLTAQTGTQTGNSFFVDGLSPGETVTLEVVAIGGGACGNSSAQQSCTAQDCPVVTIDIVPVGDICRTANTTEFDLDVTVNGGDGTGTLSFSGTGISDTSLGTFDPQQANLGANSVTATYAQANCIFSENIIINVFETPTADFTAETGLCLGTSATVTFTGSAPVGATFNWDFGGGSASPGTGQGPHEVEFAAAGNHTVTLTVESPNGCISEVASQNIVIDAPLAAPVISCAVTTSSVAFSWTADPNATDYLVTVLSGQTGSFTSPTIFEVTGLQPAETVAIEVTAVGNSACGDLTIQHSCTSEDCPPVALAIDPVAAICRDAATAAFDLTATITGNTTGTLTWSGNGIVDGQAGTFDPQLASTGANVITLTYIEAGCVFTENIIINVNDNPQGSISAPAQVCANTPATVTFTGSTAGVNFDWNFGGGIAMPGTGPGPHQVTWSSPGNHTVLLTLIGQNGCYLENLTANIETTSPLPAPVVSCDATTSSVAFTWQNVPGATSSSVQVLTGQTPTSTTANSYLFTGLAAEEMVELELSFSNGNSTCPPTVVVATCNALPCPDLTVAVAPVADICLGTAVPVQLNATVTGSDGSGSGTWSGNGVNPSTGQFDPGAVAFGQHVVTYTFAEQDCIYENSTTINVYQQPTASFTADAVICISETATVTFSGNAGAAASYTWDFGGATATPGTGPGPHQLSWTTPGSKTVTLSVEENGCASQIFTQQIQVDEQLATPVITCTATTETVEFTWNEVPNATGYSVAVIAGPNGVMVGNSYLVSGLSPGQPVSIQLSVNGSTSCPLPLVTAACQAADCPNIVIDILPTGPFCLTGDMAPVQLQAQLTGADGTGTGTWSGTGIIDAANGIFDGNTLAPGDYPVTYTYQQANCSYSQEMTITLVPPPVADAGEDFTFGCWENDQEYRLGGSGSAAGLDIQYLWTLANGTFPSEDDILHPTVTKPGIYTLTVTNAALGCSDTDEVTVFPNLNAPVPQIHVQQFSCTGQNDAWMAIQSVSGGTEPFLFSLNGEPYVQADTFPFLVAGDYELDLIDAAGCESSVNFTIEPAADLSIELTTNLVGRPIIQLGESVQLLVVSSLPAGALDSIHWSPSEPLDCTDCLNPIATPEVQTEFSVTVFLNGCAASDVLTIYVENDSPVYVPTAFSPNSDGTNDFFTIYAGRQVAQVKRFLVFDRWGEMVFKMEDFIPGEPSMGWDGNFRGQPMQPGVFAWFVEVELDGGEMVRLEGDVVLVR